MESKFNVYGMTCASCQSHVTKAVEKVEGVKSVNVNLLKNNMIVSFNENLCSEDAIIKAVVLSGYNASVFNEFVKSEVKTEENHSLRDLVISVILLLILMYFSMGVMMWGWPSPKVFDMEKCPMGFSLIQFIICLPIIYINRRYFISGFKKLFKGPNMDTLIAIGASVSMLYGIYCLFMIALGHTHYHMYLYFESAAMILVFVSLGKYLEELSKRKTTSAIEALVALAPSSCIVLKNGSEVTIKSSDVKVGDTVVCKNGSSIAVDGEIIYGDATINEANITGESMPVEKSVGDSVYSSTTITSGYIRVCAKKVGEDTSIANIIRLVDEASNSKAPISKLADKISSIFVPVILILATITFIANFLYSHISNPFGDDAFEIALNFAITVIVIACPCALGLATPVAIMVGSGKGASNGLLIKNASILEQASLIKTVVVDKTGTITKGKPEVCDFINYSKDDLASVLYSFEILSEHPLAKSIVNYTSNLKKEVYKIDNYEAIAGLGIKGYINTDLYEIGNAKFLDKEFSEYDTYNKLSEEGKSVLLIIKNHEVVGLISLRDNLKDTSKEGISLLKKKGIEVVMLTGDNEKTANAIAREAGITKVIAEVLPSDKADIIRSLKTDSKHLVAMVGDGVNDAIALKTADLGIAIGGGSDVAIDSADIVLLKDDIIDVSNTIDLSKRVLRTIKLGLFWAFFYNAICVFLATGILYYLTGGKFKMEPMYGSIAMSVSSVSVVLNALTINLFKVKNKTKDTCEIKIKVKGMMCDNCKRHVEEACKDSAGVVSANANLKGKYVVISGDNIDIEEVKNNIIKKGYRVK